MGQGVRHIEKEGRGDGDAPSRQAEADQQLEHLAGRQTDRVAKGRDGAGTRPDGSAPNKVAKGRDGAGTRPDGSAREIKRQ